MKPFLVTVDDDPEVSRAVERDLRRKYGGTYRILRAESGPEALASLEQLKLRNEPVAMFLADQRMPQMTGVEFLSRAIGLYPDAKRALLTAYADTDAAIRAINDAQVDYYLLKPWHPPEERLYPIIDDLLDDWQGSFKMPFHGIRVLGHRWSPHTHQIKEFLGRNQVPYQWLDIEKEPETRSLLQSAHATEVQLPVLVFPDGSSLIQPTTSQVAEKVGFRTLPDVP
jgi:thioredoxin reductase (NADPH)